MPGEVAIFDKLDQSSEKPEREVTAIIEELPAPDILSRFLEGQRKDYYAWKIILFFSKYPCVRFNRLAVIHALNQDSGRRCILDALDELTEQGVLKISNEGRLPLYSLTDGVRALVQKLTRPTQRG